jgi:methylthioxylose transferase
VIAGLRRAVWRPRAVPLALLALAGAGTIAILVADLSGLSKSEVERIWLPFALWLVPLAALLPRPSVRWWLLAQAALALAVNHLLLTVW